MKGAITPTGSRWRGNPARLVDSPRARLLRRLPNKQGQLKLTQWFFAQIRGLQAPTTRRVPIRRAVGGRRRTPELEWKKGAAERGIRHPRALNRRLRARSALIRAVGKDAKPMVPESRRTGCTGRGTANSIENRWAAYCGLPTAGLPTAERRQRGPAQEV
jgi:hypothetical protein